MLKEKKLPVQLLGALILLRRFFLDGFKLTGYCLCGLPPAGLGRDPAAPSLTPVELLTWTGLQWRLARQAGGPGEPGEANPAVRL